jgi:ABC-2 type transport system ATP-binding protein
VTAVATPATRALEVDRVTRRFGDREALRDVSFALDAGETVAVIGPNGAGKTTLLSVIGGVLEPSSGTVSRAPADIGWVPQQPAVYSKLTVRENLELFARLEGLADIHGAVDRMLGQTALRERADDALGTLSGGNRQRVNIAVGLLGDPAVLLLDEPSSSLDPRQRARLWEFVAQLAAGGTAVLFTTHDVAEAQRHADRVIVLADGEVLFDDTPDRLHAESGSAGRRATDLEGAFVRFLAERGH